VAWWGIAVRFTAARMSTERVFDCEQCSFVCDWDLNASLYLASLAVSSTVSARGVDSADTTTLKQEISFKFAHE
jgi:putative transposase